MLYRTILKNIACISSFNYLHFRWDTILHAENKQAKMLITANKMRMKDLKRRLAELQKMREREKRRNAPRKPDVTSDDEAA